MKARLFPVLPLLLALTLHVTGAGAAGEGSRTANPVSPPALSEEDRGTSPRQWLQEKTGDHLPLDARFNNEKGETVTLRQLIDRPTLLLPVYYTCPNVCSIDQANLAGSLRRSRTPYGSFRVISLSFNEQENPHAAALVKPNYLQILPKEFSPDDWTFLTGDSGAIREVTQAIGYSFKRRGDVFLHPTALVVLDKTGRIIKYVYGSFITGDIDLALAEAAKGTPAGSIRRLIAFCFPADPHLNKLVLNLMRAGVALIFFIGGILLVRLLFGRRSSPSSTNS